MIILCYIIKKFTKFDPGWEAIQTLSKIVCWAIIANLFFFFCEVFVVFYSNIPGHLAHMQYLLFGYHGYHALVPWMWTGITLMILGAVFLVIPQLRNNKTLLPFTCAMIFIGAWIDKGLGMISGGFVPSPLHHVTEYAPSGKEIIITLAVYATGFLILTILFKIATQVKEEVRG